MKGPYPIGTCVPHQRADETPWEGPHAARGQRYRVVKAFIDADGDHHAIGEEWMFLYSTFSRFDEILTLFIRWDSNDEWGLPLSWDQPANADVIDNFSSYAAPISGGQGQ